MKSDDQANGNTNEKGNKAKKTNPATSAHVVAFASRLLKQPVEQPNPDLPPFDPPTGPRLLTVTIDQIQPYDRNPRQAPNPKYADIKASVRTMGLQEPPAITARPGADHYIIRRGGNTRLQILKELWEETGDPRFYQIECRYEPYDGEVALLAGHMVENEQRGNMLFIERAEAAVNLRQAFAQEDGVDPESFPLRDLAERISATGWTVHYANLSPMLYAVERLLPHMPAAFWDAGMGRPAVKQIRKLHEAAIQLWGIRGNGDGYVEVVFSEALASAGTDEYRFPDLMEDLVAGLDKALVAMGSSRPTCGIIEQELDNYMRGIPPLRYKTAEELGPIVGREERLKREARARGKVAQAAAQGNAPSAPAASDEPDHPQGGASNGDDTAQPQETGLSDAVVMALTEEAVMARVHRLVGGLIAGRPFEAAIKLIDRFPFYTPVKINDTVYEAPIQRHPETGVGNPHHLLASGLLAELLLLFSAVRFEEPDANPAHEAGTLRSLLQMACRNQPAAYLEQRLALLRLAINPGPDERLDAAGALADLQMLEQLLTAAQRARVAAHHGQ